MGEINASDVIKIEGSGDVQRATEIAATVVKPRSHVEYRPGRTPEFLLDGEKQKNVRTEYLEAVITDLPGSSGTMLMFKHPVEGQIIGVLVAPKAGPHTTPEVDGVWVADEGG